MRVNEPGVSRQGWNGEQGASASRKPPVPSLPAQTSSHDDAEKGGKKSVFRHFFAGISWIQILAGGLAAVTVFLLSSKLGLAGTIIGAALASMISTFASQLYQNILKVANSKLLSTSADDSQQSRSPHESSTAVRPSSTQPSSACASDVPESSQVHRRIVGTSDQSQLSSTTVMPLSQALAGTSPDYQSDTVNGRADNLKKNKQKKLAIIISVVVALLSVALVTGTIMLITGGKPTDTVLPSTRVEHSQTPTHNSPDSSQQGEETSKQKERSQSGSDEEKKAENQSSSGSSQDDGSTNSTTNGSDSSQSSNTNESQSSTNSGSSSDSSSSSNSGSSNSDSNSSNSSPDSSNSGNSGNSSNSDSSTGSSSDANSQGSNDSSSQSGSAGDSSSRTQK